MTTVRLFVALNLPDDVRARIAHEVIDPLRPLLRGVRWVRDDMLHVTLAFLGERNEAEAREAHAVVREVAGSRGPLQVTLSGLGVFPNAAKPRVLWLGLADPNPVRELHRVFERERARLGVPAEGRAYHPHVTLGRVAPNGEATVSEDLEGALAAVDFEASVMLSSLDLMRSELSAAGPRYATLLAAPLSRVEGR
jgi:2'-5' RNA ligase